MDTLNSIVWSIMREVENPYLYLFWYSGAGRKIYIFCLFSNNLYLYKWRKYQPLNYKLRFLHQHKTDWQRVKSPNISALQLILLAAKGKDRYTFFERGDKKNLKCLFLKYKSGTTLDQEKIPLKPNFNIFWTQP